MFAAATQAVAGFLKVSVISQNYSIAGSSSLAGAPPPPSDTPPFTVGLWRVCEAVHKTHGKRVSVWTFTKRNDTLERLSAQAKERIIQIMKAEASSLGRMRHPCVLEMVEPLEETRSEIIFATEPVISTLAMSIPGSPSARRHTEPLDEIEIQKGILQLSKGLAFLHTSARLVHSNLNPDSVLVNAAGDWKISGLGLIIPLVGPDGTPTRWEFPTYDVRLPPSVQRSFDYIAPEYVLNEQIVTASDMYSLGCIIYAVHAKGVPPFRNHNSLSSMRSNVGRLEGGGGIAGMNEWDRDLQNLLTSLITPTPLIRLSSDTISSHSFFSSIAVSTLNFLDPSTFAPKPREEKMAFMKGLQTVLPRFSESLRRRKVLPSLLAEMKDPLLLPSILPNVFSIASTLNAEQFQKIVLPSLKPVFAVRDPPQNMMVLLENLEELQKKTGKAVFRTDILPLVYNALESEHAAVQERALQTVPMLCEAVDYAEIQNVLFLKIAIVFTKTRIQSVKIATLVSFLSLVKTLDQATLTQKMVVLLAKIRTKDPGVMLAALAVHEAMGTKVDREAVATHILPQLWGMSVGPLLNVEQFGRFMSVIRMLSERVEREHAQHLRDTQRIEDRSASNANGASPNLPFASGPVDFETLVSNGRRNGTATPSSGAAAAVRSGGLSGASSPTPSASAGGWDDDGWGGMLGDSTPQLSTPAFSPTPTQVQSLPPTPAPRIPGPNSPFAPPSSRGLGAARLPTPVSRLSTSTTSSSSFPPPMSISQARPTLGSAQSVPTIHPAAPPSSISPFTSLTPTPSSFSPMQPSRPIQPLAQVPSQAPSRPNYNITLEPLQPSAPTPSFTASMQQPMQPLRPQSQAPQNFFNSTPLEPQRPQGWNASGLNGNNTTSKGKANVDLGGFDPLL